MPISVAHPKDLQTRWITVNDGVTVYVGSLIALNTSAPLHGATVLPDSAGVANNTNKDVPFGVVIGTNRKEPLFSTTYNTEYITAPAAADPHDGASIEYAMDGQPGDPVSRVKIALIDSTTVLRAPIFNGAVGTGPTVGTVTTGSTDGLGCTTTAVQTATVVGLSTIYIRSGANRGAQRIATSASTTVHTWTPAVKSDIAVGDTLVSVPLRDWGLSTIMFDDVSMTFIDMADAPDLAMTDRFLIQVVRLDLSVAGSEYAEFRFDGSHFTSSNTNTAP
jgi:hypothetical protein